MKTNEASKQNPALEPLKKFIGKWVTEGTHPYVPDTTLHGHISYEWIEGGAFLLMRSSIDEPRFPSGISIFGSDDVTGNFFMLYFDERDISRKYDVSFQDNIFEWHRDTPEFAQRFTFTISADGRTMIGKGTMRKDNQDWEKDLELTCRRV